MRSTRAPLVIVIAVAFTAVVTAWAADYVVEDWRSYPIGTRGIPGDWKPQNWGQAAYDFEIVADNGQPVLHLKSEGDSSTISRDLRGQFNLSETSVLAWSWSAFTIRVQNVQTVQSLRSVQAFLDYLNDWNDWNDWNVLNGSNRSPRRQARKEYVLI
jgi:hypothetical protein